MQTQFDLKHGNENGNSRGLTAGRKLQACRLVRYLHLLYAFSVSRSSPIEINHVRFLSQNIAGDAAVGIFL